MKNIDDQSTVVLIGAGIMSATLGTLIKELVPGCTIKIYERLDKVAGESSDPWNNAGTGHSALCELNYTPERADGTIEGFGLARLTFRAYGQSISIFPGQK